MTSQRLLYRPLGLVLDIPAENVAPEFYTSAENFNFSDLSATRSLGYDDLTGPPLFKPLRLHWIRYGTVDYWVYAGPGGVGVWNGAAHVNITPAGWVAGGDGDGIMLSELNGLVILNDSTQSAS